MYSSSLDFWYKKGREKAMEDKINNTLKPFEKCSILKETNINYSNSSDKLQYMNIKEHIFSLICSCGHIVSGIITGNDIYDIYDKLHCDCGLVWKVNKPYKESEK